MAPQLACGHVLDHALTQRADGAIGTHGELLLSEVLRPRSFLRTGLPAPTMVSSRLATNPRSGTPRSGLSRQRFSAMARSRPTPTRRLTRTLRWQPKSNRPTAEHPAAPSQLPSTVWRHDRFF